VEIESKYLDEESANEGDIIEFLDEGSKEVKVSPRDQKQYVVYNFLVSNGRYTLTYTPSGDATKMFIKKYGRETKNWKNTKFVVKFIEKMVFGVTKKVLIPSFLEVKA